MKALVVYNNFSGNCNNDKVIYICEKLRQKYDYIEKFASVKERSITEKIIESGSCFDLIVTVGGDGSIHDTINGLMRLEGKKPLLAYIPLGTCNDVGHTLGLSGKLEKTMDAILEAQTVDIDVFKANEEYFVYALAAGYLTEISYLAPSTNKKKIGKIAYYLEAIKHIKKNNNISVSFESKEQSLKGEYSILLALNTRYLAGFRIRRRDSFYLNDGTINITFIRKTYKIMNIIDFALFLLFGERYTHNIIYFKTTGFRLESKDTISFNADGEHLVDDRFLNVCVKNKALKVIVDPKIKNKYFKNNK